MGVGICIRFTSISFHVLRQGLRGRGRMLRRTVEMSCCNSVHGNRCKRRWRLHPQKSRPRRFCLSKGCSFISFWGLNLWQFCCQRANRGKSTIRSKILRLDSVSICQDVVVRCKLPASIHAKETSCSSTRVFILDPISEYHSGFGTTMSPMQSILRHVLSWQFIALDFFEEPHEL